MIEITEEKTIKLLRLASLGKLFQGLIHNVNGPMQNLGLDIEMCNYQIRGNADPENDLIKDLEMRLQRIEQEFNNLDSLIKSTAIKAEPGTEFSNYLNINVFIEQELDFFNANLYFKHNVNTNLDLRDNPPSIDELPKNFLLALGWIMQSIVEELEHQKIKSINIVTSGMDSRLDIAFYTEEESFSKEFMEIFNQDIKTNTPLPDSIDTGVSLALMIFYLNGIAVKGASEGKGSLIQLNIPLKK